MRTQEQIKADIAFTTNKIHGLEKRRAHYRRELDAAWEREQGLVPGETRVVEYRRPLNVAVYYGRVNSWSDCISVRRLKKDGTEYENPNKFWEWRKV